MWNKFLASVLLVSACTVSMSAQAALIATDWKLAGDAQATLDTQTGLEWLDLSLTAKVPLSELKTRLASGDLKGWRFPTEAEVVNLHLNYDPSLYSTSKAYLTSADGLTNADMDPWRALFGKTHSLENASMGVFQKTNGTWGAFGAYRPGLLRWYTMGYVASLSLVDTWAGYFLVSDGGLTMSSLNDPMLNVNNPNAPVNNQTEPTPGPTPDPAPAVVSAPVTPAVVLAFGFLCVLVRRMRKNT